MGRGEYQTPHYNARMRDERGFSLPEVLVALLILTIVLTVSFTAFLSRNRKLQQARETIIVYQALANEAEYWRRIPFGDLEKELAFRSDPKELLEGLGVTGTAISVEKTKNDDVRHVTMSIRWHEGQRVARLTLVRVHTGGGPLW
jgi:prepilin-type N-terminal cleavage/methylation domain-containing protein